MNRIQMVSGQLESERLKLLMGLDPAVDIDALTLRAMWQQVCIERQAFEGYRPDPAGAPFFHTS